MNNIFIAQKIFEEENGVMSVLSLLSNGKCSVMSQLASGVVHFETFKNYIDLIEYLETTKL